jgi:hypothetical protein
MPMIEKRLASLSALRVLRKGLELGTYDKGINCR